MERIRSDCLIIGGGIAGLAIAKSLVKRYKNIFLIEKNKSLGQEVSSRNSEVIHAGIYYKKDSLKAKLCVEGKKLLYDYLTHRDIPFVKCGKFIVSNSYDETKKLTEIKDNAQECGVEDLEFNNTELKKYPFITFSEALYSPSSGIFDSQRFIMSLKDEFEQDGGIVILGNECLNIEKDSKGLEVTIHDKNTGEKFIIETNLLINGAGLNAVTIANELHGEEKFANKFLKGEYYNYQGKEKLDHLIYPIPEEAGLGVHLTIDLNGQARFGPDVEWIDKIEYDVDSSRAGKFYHAIRNYWPDLKDDTLIPGYSGIRPKLKGEGLPAMDFVFSDPLTHGVQGLVNLFGIESPGLTSSLVIADKAISYI